MIQVLEFDLKYADRPLISDLFIRLCVYCQQINQNNCNQKLAALSEVKNKPAFLELLSCCR